MASEWAWNRMEECLCRQTSEINLFTSDGSFSHISIPQLHQYKRQIPLIFYKYWKVFSIETYFSTHRKLHCEMGEPHHVLCGQRVRRGHRVGRVPTNSTSATEECSELPLTAEGSQVPQIHHPKQPFAPSQNHPWGSQSYSGLYPAFICMQLLRFYCIYLLAPLQCFKRFHIRLVPDDTSQLETTQPVTETKYFFFCTGSCRILNKKRFKYKVKLLSCFFVSLRRKGTHHRHSETDSHTSYQL